MFIPKNFPDLLEQATPELMFPPLPINCSPSRTAAALLKADTDWRCLLNHDTSTLHTHLASMQELARRFFRMDGSLAMTLDHLW